LFSRIVLPVLFVWLLTLGLAPGAICVDGCSHRQVGLIAVILVATPIVAIAYYMWRARGEER
jgi:uncharacterized membrane protein YoaK (UPF0700 family)